jgi:hypothetical protein
MNQITIETNVEIEAGELQALAAKQAEEAIAELNSAQLALVGGGLGIGILD